MLPQKLKHRYVPVRCVTPYTWYTELLGNGERKTVLIDDRSNEDVLRIQPEGAVWGDIVYTVTFAGEEGYITNTSERCVCASYSESVKFVTSLRIPIQIPPAILDKI